MPCGFRGICCWALSVALCAGLGCTEGPNLVPVSGQVLIDGEPLTTGHIQVIPQDERAATGTIDADGRFRLSTYEEDDGCVVGSHPVVVMATRQLSPTKTEHLIPPTYRKPETAGLTVTIEGPTDDLKINLTWAGRKPYIEEISTQGDVAPVGTEQAAEAK